MTTTTAPATPEAGPEGFARCLSRNDPGGGGDGRFSSPCGPGQMTTTTTVRVSLRDRDLADPSGPASKVAKAVVLVISRSRNSRVHGKRTDLHTCRNLSKVHGQRTDWHTSRNHSVDSTVHGQRTDWHHSRNHSRVHGKRTDLCTSSNLPRDHGKRTDGLRVRAGNGLGLRVAAATKTDVAPSKRPRRRTSRNHSRVHGKWTDLHINRNHFRDSRGHGQRTDWRHSRYHTRDSRVHGKTTDSLGVASGLGLRVAAIKTDVAPSKLRHCAQCDHEQKQNYFLK